LQFGLALQLHSAIQAALRADRIALSGVAFAASTEASYTATRGPDLGFASQRLISAFSNLAFTLELRS
jgi:hypothetical protein